MKIRCGSHQQNRSIVRPGLSLMATKVALTAEEFRENSQRSIALFNTEKLSTDSTHVLKSAYCILCISAVAICTERVEAKPVHNSHLQECYHVAICTERVEAKARATSHARPRRGVAICTERVEAKFVAVFGLSRRPSCNLHGACGGKGALRRAHIVEARLQSARSVWRQSIRGQGELHRRRLQSARSVWRQRSHTSTPVRQSMLQSARSVWRQSGRFRVRLSSGGVLQSARSVWRQRRWHFAAFRGTMVAICTERVEAKNHSNLDYTVKRVAICTRRVEDLASSSEKNPRKFMQTYCIFIHLGV